MTTPNAWIIEMPNGEIDAVLTLHAPNGKERTAQDALKILCPTAKDLREHIASGALLRHGHKAEVLKGIR